MPPITSDRIATIVELFSSIQGEGLLVGLRQAFLRFHGCNLGCVYCDTESGIPPTFAQIETTPGRRDFRSESNPVSLDTVLRTLDSWLEGWPGIHHSLSITGGEPLLHHKTLRIWLPELQCRLPIYLETNGVLPHVLAEIIEFIEFISMDIKLPSTSGCADLWGRHREFLEVARDKTVYVKIVVSEETPQDEIVCAGKLIADVDPDIPCILQPLTRSDGNLGIAPVTVLGLQETASRYLSHVRIIPQTHRFMGQL